MGKKIAVLLGSFILGFIISFFYVNLQYQQTGTATSQPSLPSDHPPVAEDRDKEAAGKSSKTGPLAALGGPAKAEADSDEKSTANQSSDPTSDTKATSPETAAPAGNKPSALASTVYKNLKILKDIPSNELLTVMQSFTEGLGVNCTYCHVSVQDLAQDGKPEKETAREMLLMVREINKKYPTEGSVTCYTCHRGTTKPAS
jgi:hypothetical protein